MVNFRYGKSLYLAALALAALVAGPVQAPAQIVPSEVTGQLPAKRAKHAAVLHNGQLYILGGQQGRKTPFFKTVFRAPIDESGQPGNWTLETPLPTPRANIDNLTFVHENRIHVLGGFDGDVNKWVMAPMSARIRQTGEIGEWSESAAIPGPARGGLAVATSENAVVVCGGLDDATKTAIPNVYVANFGLEGVIGEWREAIPLPAPAAYAGAAIVKGRLYVWGGLPNSDPMRASLDAYSSEISADGTIGPWRSETTGFPNGMWDNSYFTMGNNIFHVTPRYPNNGFGPEIYWSNAGKGQLGKFSKVTLAILPVDGMGVAESPATGDVFLTGGATGYTEDLGNADIRRIRLRGGQSAANTIAKGASKSPDAVAQKATPEGAASP